MPTARTLTVSPSMLCSGGVPGPGGVCSGGCTWSGGVSAPRGCTWSRGVYLVLRGVPGPGRVYLVPGVYLVLGGVPGLGGSAPGGYLVRYSPPVNRMNDRHV